MRLLLAYCVVGWNLSIGMRLAVAANLPDASAVVQSMQTRSCVPSIIKGDVDVDGFSGRFTMATNPKTHLGLIEVTGAGPGNFAIGVGRTGAWVREPDGSVHDADFAGYKAGLVSDIYWASGGLSNPCWPAQARAVGQTTFNGHVADLLDVIPEGGKTTRVWIAADTHRVLRWTRRDEPDIATVSYATSAEATQGRSPADETIVNRDGTRWNLRVTSRQEPATTASIDRLIARQHAPKDARIDGLARLTSVPMRIAGQPFVDVYINGKGPFNFLVDTGGSLQLTPSTATTVGLAQIGAGTDTGIGGSRISFPFATVADLQIGAAHIKDLYASVFDLHGLPTGPGRKRLDGIVGYEVLARFVTTFDYVHGTFTLALDDVSTRSEKRLAIPFALDHTFPVTGGRINGVSAAFWIDTGSNALISITKPFAVAHAAQLPGPRTVNGSIRGVGGSGGRLATGPLRSVEIGPMVLSDPVASYVDADSGLLADTEMAANLGDPGFYSTALSFDYRHRRAWIVRESENKIKSDGINR